ncbi:TIGR02281 family clan AA aspartic protease [Shinella yambaruensis]|uniref:Membrane protein n=1 Tax=Shinella yambaruensis TaxID=415996 RepID=A0ABQ5ZIE3_9HYPH|nr:TIGR02281 family clan AA aspartic protease [Shinella yambaruensis]MCJ8029080.1 TIGR02281 family clan AA aspartic protease [Shinella yambaruensis]MCU7982520.1 TIGR02281 family clan AA aspartic protease [Shinella yambaruensis]GLR51602.1 membrane protein [Shinella yambaruensis]
MFVRSLVFLVGSVVAAAAFVPGVATRYLDATAEAPEATVEKAAVETGRNAARYTGNRSAVISADPSGHFTGLFAINGRKEEGLVDTGASMVAINISTAQRLGIARTDLDFRYAVDTANGKARAAYIRLDHVEIGPVRMENVGAMVLDDKALSGTLIGMSFLKGLSSYRVEGGKLHLTR